MKNIPELQEVFRVFETAASPARFLLGFDGCIDHITKPIFSKTAQKTEYFDSQTMFVDYLDQMKQLSCSVELEESAQKIGGNNPITAGALANLGMQVRSIGAYGDGSIDGCFAELAKKCELISVAAPARCFAMEFEQNKIMTYINCKDQSFTPQALLEKVPKEVLIEYLKETNLIALLNFSEMPVTVGLWEMFCDEIFPHLKALPIVFFDFSDCSRMDAKLMDEAVRVVRKIAQKTKVCIGFNSNEFSHIYEHQSQDAEQCAALSRLVQDAAMNDDTMVPYLRQMQDYLGVQCVILRTYYRFFACEEDGSVCSTKNMVCDTPRVLTGAGDNHNAALCACLANRIPMQSALQFATWFGRYYIQNGVSPNLEQLQAYVESI